MLINKNTLLENEISLLINLFNKGSYIEVIEKGKVIITKHSLSYMVYNIVGSAYSKIKKYDEALNYYRKTVEINPQFSQGFNNLGYTCWKLGQLDLAEKNCLKALKLNKNYAFALNTLGNIYQDKSENDKAMRSFQKAIDIDNKYIEPQYNTSLLNLSQVKFDLAWKSPFC